MEYISTANRSQLEFNCLENLIERENPVRFIEAFVEKLDLTQLHFTIKETQSEGRPSFNPKVFIFLIIQFKKNSAQLSIQSNFLPKEIELRCSNNLIIFNKKSVQLYA